MSQQELAEAISTTQNQIYRYEQDKNSPTADVIIALTTVLETSADWLLGMTDIIKPLTREVDLTDFEREVLTVIRTRDTGR